MLPITVDLNILGTLLFETLSDSIQDSLSGEVNTVGIEPAPTETGSYLDEPFGQPDPLVLSPLGSDDPADLDEPFGQPDSLVLPPLGGDDPVDLGEPFGQPDPLVSPPEDDDPIYLGETFGQPDPLLNPFPQDTVVVGEASKTVFRWQDNWQPREVIVQKLYSESNDATWANAYVPDGTFVFIREQEIMNGTQPVQGMTKADGADYFWTQSGMTSGSVASQACISLPIFSFGMGHDLYDHLCTDFSQPPLGQASYYPG